MTFFRIILVAIIAAVGVYTIVVIGENGTDFITPFFADIAETGWPGQFNMDFWSFLILGSTWLMWRHHFSPLGLLFGLLIFAGGAPFLCTYLLVASFRAGGDVKELLLGRHRVAR